MHGRFGVLVVDLHGCQHETIQCYGEVAILTICCRSGSLMSSVSPFCNRGIKSYKVRFLFHDVMYVLSSLKGFGVSARVSIVVDRLVFKFRFRTGWFLETLDMPFLRWRRSSPTKGLIQLSDRSLAFAIATITRQSARSPYAPRSSRR